MKILRVFPERTSMTPTDDLVRIGAPDLLPDPDDITQVHVSCVFTWHRDLCRQLRKLWKERLGVPVILGGPAFEDEGHAFVPGRYLKHGITITSRGCPNRCAWCYVPKREGELRLLPITDGDTVQDNAILACPEDHFAAVCEMLTRQAKGARFVGGFDAKMLSHRHIKHMAPLRIREIWLACDTMAALGPLSRAVEMLRCLPAMTSVADPRQKLRCYVLIGRGAESIDRAERRLDAVWRAGCLPFAQLFRDDNGLVQTSREWRALARKWSRPAAMYAAHKVEVG